MKPILPDKVYNILKYVALVALPLIATFWVTIGEIWGLPLVPQIAGTITAIDALLGGLLGVSTHFYNKQLEGK